MSNRLEEIRHKYIDELGSAMNDDQKEKLVEIMDDERLTKREMNQSIKKLCETSGNAATKKYHEIEKVIAAHDAKIIEKLKKVEENFTDDTKILLQKAAEIHEDETNSYELEHEKMKILFNDASPEVKTDLRMFGAPFTYFTKNKIAR